MATAGKPLPETPPSPSNVGTSEHDDGLLAFASVRRRLFGIASLTACSEVRRKPRISCKTFGCGGSSPQIAAP